MTTPMDREVEGRLSDHDVRYTKGRRAVVETLAGSEGPRSAAELHADMERGMPLSSLYRSLAVLEQAGVVSPHYSTKGVTRYELAEWLTGHHHHLVCVSCGVVEDIDLPKALEEDLRGIVKKVGARASFRPTDHALEVDGFCARCA